MDPILSQFRPQMQVLNRPTRQAVRAIARAYAECRALGLNPAPKDFIDGLSHAADEGDALLAIDILTEALQP